MQNVQANLGGSSSPLCGTWEYLCGQREYNITEKKGVLVFSQTDPELHKLVTGTLQRVRDAAVKEEIYEAALSNRGRISVHYFTGTDKQTGQKEDCIETRYMPPGSRRWGHKVHANRVNREIMELKDMNRQNHLHREMRKLQKQMSQVLDRLGVICQAQGKNTVRAAKAASGIRGVEQTMTLQRGSSSLLKDQKERKMSINGQSEDDTRLPGQADDY